MGVGLCVVVRPDAVEAVVKHLGQQGCEAYAIGEIVTGKQVVNYRGNVRW
jgi:phosphoribosylaminoimidazole (AIR) synthetase